MVNALRLSLIALTVVAFSACEGAPGSVLVPDDITAGTMSSATVEAGGAGKPTHWSAMTAKELWAHVAALDSTVLVGLKEPAQRRGIDERGRALVPGRLWTPFARRVEALGVDLLYVDDFHPLVKLRLSGPDQIEALRRSPFVEYVEPASFDVSEVLMEFGCGSTDVGISGRTQSPGDIVPGTLAWHQIPEAWQLSIGTGVTIGVVDTGTSIFQPQLQQEFTTGLSAGRTISYDYSDANSASGPPPWHDTCGHGTKSLGLAAAPRDGRNIVGVAYGANAYAVRAIDDVTAGPGQWLEVRDGIRRAADNAHIVNMAFGWTWGNSEVTSTIQYYHNNTNPVTNQRTLFIGAAGTHKDYAYGTISPPGRSVVYPANLPEVVAVTGTRGGTSPCSNCNYGPEVEFAAYTEGQTTGRNEGQIEGFGGSSAATAVVSGIAALVWSRYPTWSRDQVLARMRESARWRTPQVRDDRIGHGTIDALQAVGGLAQAHLGGPSPVYDSGTYGYEIFHEGGVGPFTYQWSTGETTKQIMVTVETRAEDYTFTLSGSVTDGNGMSRSVQLHVLVYSNFGLGVG